jgi:hypothetical protein
MKTYGEWRYSSTILHVGTRWRWTVSFTPLPLSPPGEKTSDTNRIRGWVGSRAGLNPVKKRKISFPCRKSKPCHHARSCSDWAIPTYVVININREDNKQLESLLDSKLKYLNASNIRWWMAWVRTRSNGPATWRTAETGHVCSRQVFLLRHCTASAPAPNRRCIRHFNTLARPLNGLSSAKGNTQLDWDSDYSRLHNCVSQRLFFSLDPLLVLSSRYWDFHFIQSVRHWMGPQSLATLLSRFENAIPLSQWSNNLRTLDHTASAARISSQSCFNI